MNNIKRTHDADVANWELSDSMGERIAPLLPKPKSRFRGCGRARYNVGGRPAADPRQVMSAILYILRTDCQWNALPRQFGISGKTQRWVRAGVFKRMWQAGLNECDLICPDFSSPAPSSFDENAKFRDRFLSSSCYHYRYATSC